MAKRKQAPKQTPITAHALPLHMNPNYLGKLVMVGMNKKFYKPPVAQIKERYYKMRGATLSPLTHLMAPPLSPVDDASGRRLRLVDDG